MIRLKQALVVLGAMCIVLATDCAGSPDNTIVPDQETHTAEPAPVCGLSLPCEGTMVSHSHDLYGAIKSGLEGTQSLLVSVTDQEKGCIACVEPETFFSAILNDPQGAKGVLSHIYLSLKEPSRKLFSEKPPSPIDSAWREIHIWAAEQLDLARSNEEKVSCELLTAYCASGPRFIEAFVEFSGTILSMDPPDEDPGFQKESTVKLALALNPPGALPVIIRFIKSRAHVRARMKAVRDICGYVRLKEVREVIEWVVENDPELADRAGKCLAPSR